MSDPTPAKATLVGLPALLSKPDAEVLLTFDSGSCIAASNYDLGYVCVCPPRNRPIGEVDLSPLKGRRLLVWPDAGREGWKAADAIARVLEDAVILKLPPNLADGWNLKHAASEGKKAIWVEAHIAEEKLRIQQEYERVRIATSVTPPTINGHDHSAPVAEEVFDEDDSKVVNAEYDPPIDEAIDPRCPPYRVLGQDHGFFYFFPFSTCQVFCITAPGFTKHNFRVIAPNEYWKRNFAEEGKSVSWDAVHIELVDKCTHMKAPFNPLRLRGRGCWVDATGPDKATRVIFHAGDKIIDGDKVLPIEYFKSRYIYEKGDPVAFYQTPPASNAEANKVRQLCALLPFRGSMDATFLAGWCVLATISGALKWRPHLWVAGEPGSGKTTISTDVIDPLLGDFKLFIQSSTTEAGIRDNIRNDAIPVLFDESEADTARGQIRIQQVLELARQASSETGGVILKGTADHKGIAFNIRSCFCLSSVGVAATQRADTSRFTVVTLEKRPLDSTAPDKYKEFLDLVATTTANPAWCASIRTRSMLNIHSILHNIRMFRAAVDKRVRDKRASDQIGTLIAGAFSLTSTRQLTADEADKWVNAQDWSSFMPADVDKDSVQCFGKLMGGLLVVDGDDHPRETTSYGNLLMRYYQEPKPTDGPEAVSSLQKDRELAAKVLQLHGVKPTPTHVDVSTSHDSIAKVFRDSPWSGKWRDQLSRLPVPDGHLKPKEVPSARFGAAFHRAVRLPIILWTRLNQASETS